MALNLGAPLNFGTAPDIKQPDYGFTQSYNNALQLNQQLYAQAISGYQEVLESQRQRHQDLSGRYTQLGQEVQGYLTGAESGQRQRIQDQYAQASGAAQQSAVDRGLGNFTVGDSLLRGVEADRAKAEVDLASQFGQMRAGYASQLGLAGLGYAAQAGQESDAMSQAALQFQGSWRQAQPDPLGYAQLMQQQKQWKAMQPYEVSGFTPGNAAGPFSEATKGYSWNYMYDPQTGRKMPGR